MSRISFMWMCVVAMALFQGVSLASSGTPADGLALEPRGAYVLAKSRIPDFEKNGRPQETWVFDPIPSGWREISLDGLWKVRLMSDASRVDYYQMSEKSGPLGLENFLSGGYQDGNWYDVRVPWPLPFLSADKTGNYPSTEDFKGYAYYQRMVDIPSYDPDRESVFLKFYGAGFRADVWVNGQYAGYHVGSFSPFELDITSRVKSGDRVSLLVRSVHTRYGISYRGALETGLSDSVRLQIRGKIFPTNVRLVIDDEKQRVNVHYDLYGPANSSSAEIEAIVEEVVGGTVVGTCRQTVSGREIKPIAIGLNHPHYWSPEDPFLYKMSIKINGEVQKIVRFGYRTIAIRSDETGQKHFYLNGRRFYMRAFEFNYWWVHMHHFRAAQNRTACINDHGRLRDALQIMKFMNVNTLRPHSMDPFYSETFYNLCDEMGLLVYFDWNGGSYDLGTGTSGKEDWTRTITSLEKTLPNFKETLAYLHNHPSLAFISYTNELYDHLLPAGYSYDPIIRKYYQAQSDIDLQNRPSSGSTGRPTYRHDAKVDFVDDHQYIGVPYGSWQDVYAYIEMTKETIHKKFSDSPPFVNMETGQIVDFRIHPQNIRLFTHELQKEDFDKKQFIKHVTEINEIRDFVRLSANAGGLRSYLTDASEYRKRKSLLTAKRYLEMFRYCHATTDGVSLNTMPHDVMKGVYGRAMSDDSYAYEPWSTAGVGLAIAEPAYCIRTAFYPVQALLRIENLHPLSGAQTPAPIHLVNDSERDVSVELRIQLRDPQGRVRSLVQEKDISIPQGRMKQIPFHISIPSDAVSGVHKVEIFLLADGQKIAENNYGLYVLAQQDRITRYPSRRVALYDKTSQKFAGLGVKSTGEILRLLHVPFDNIHQFDGLGNYDVLMIGANSLDDAVFNNGTLINQWINRGGRMVVFEQVTTGYMPWVAGERIQLLGKSSFVEHFYKKHPFFKGIEDEMVWESPWGNQGRLFETCLELNEGFLSLAAVSDFQKPEAMASVINHRRMGRGEYVISTLLTVDRYGVDSTITRYVENLMDYIMSDAISPYATSVETTGVPESHGISVDPKEVVFIDLRGAANQDLTDEVQGDRKGGWTDYGSDADMRSLPTGQTRLGGNVLFQVIAPPENQGKACVVLSGPTREYFPKESAEILINQKLDRLYFLHTLMWVKAKSDEVVLEYEVKYAHGGKATIAMKNKRDISDWWSARDYFNGQVVHRDGEKCLFLSEWVNPDPSQPIESIRAVSKGNAIPVIVAISGKQAKSQGIDRFDVDDNRKK